MAEIPIDLDGARRGGSVTPRLAALLWRIARLSAERIDLSERDRALVGAGIERAIERAIRDLDGADPPWRSRTPLHRSGNERRGRIDPRIRAKREEEP